MRHLGEDDATRMMGVGYLGEVRQGPDGALYQYVQGVDGLGNPIGGFWSRLRSRVKSVVGRALPFAQRVASFIPGPYGTAAATALKTATPILKQAGVAGYDGLGALYEAPDGSLYQVQGLAEDDELRGIGDEMTQMMGIGYLGELRQGPDGAVYQYVQGVDGLGNLTGWWSKLRKVASGVAKYHPVAAALRAAKPLVSMALPIAQQVASVIPGGTEALTAPTPILKEAGVAGYGGLGALYQSADGTVYQMQGLSDDDELRGLDEDEELRGFHDDDELRGLDEEEQIQGFAEDEELRGFDQDRDMEGLDGYVRQDGMSGIERYEHEQPPQTRWHVASSEQPKIWKRAW
jgi:hypothetical protein